MRIHGCSLTQATGQSTVARAPAAPGLRVVQPDEGHAGTRLAGVNVVFKIDGEDSGGARSIVEHPFEVGALVPPHVHHLEADELNTAPEGEICFRSEDREVVLGPGGYIVKPHGEVHAMWNAGDTRARMSEVICPGLRGLLPRPHRTERRGPPDPAQMGVLAERAGLEQAEPDRLPDVIARYGLHPPRPRHPTNQDRLNSLESASRPHHKGLRTTTVLP